MAIYLDTVRQINIQDGVSFRGYAANTTPMITLNDPTDSAKAQGSIGLIRTDCPLDMILSGNCRYIGKLETKCFYVQRVLPDNIITDIPLFFHNNLDDNIIKSKAANIDLNFNVSDGGGIGLTFLFYANDGTQVIPLISRNITVSSGLSTYRLEITTQWSNKVNRIVIRRRGDDANDTAIGVELVSISIQDYNNRVNKV